MLDSTSALGDEGILLDGAVEDGDEGILLDGVFEDEITRLAWTSFIMKTALWMTIVIAAVILLG